MTIVDERLVDYLMQLVLVMFQFILGYVQVIGVNFC